MTNTDSRNVGLEELAAGDYADLVENDGEQITAADIRELAVYGFDSEDRTLVGLGPVERARRARKAASDDQTLVGLGPVERARRAREAAETLDSERMPQSEPPGPFIAAGGELDDDERLRSLRGRKRGPWLVAVPLALVVAAAAVAVVRGLTPDAPPASPPAVAAKASHPGAELPVKLDAVSAEPAQAAVVSAEPAAVVSASDESASANDEDESKPLAERLEGAPRSATVKAPTATAALPVTLPEQPPPSVTDLAPSAADANVGSLNVTSSPPANVLLDGRPLGKAPRLVPVPAGVHTVLFIHPLYGRRSLRVKVSAGQTTTASADF